MAARAGLTNMWGDAAMQSDDYAHSILYCPPHPGSGAVLAPAEAFPHAQYVKERQYQREAEESNRVAIPWRRSDGRQNTRHD